LLPLPLSSSIQHRKGGRVTICVYLRDLRLLRGWVGEFGNFFVLSGITYVWRYEMKRNEASLWPRLLGQALVLFMAFAATGSASDREEIGYATFAGGCFWCIEADFEKIEGVVAVTSGYTGGTVKDPSYKEVSAGGTGHAEAVRVVFDPKIVSYRELLGTFWRNVDPTVTDRQFCDVGSQYRSAIFYHDEAQRAAAEESLAELERSKPFPEPIVTEITAATTFYPAEAYHQDYYKKNKLRYSYYRKGCGRDRRLAELWGEKK
jgi:peptide-methionine (S)-S-oxide reductase